ncbi:hypothetical protein F0267_02060 [Vibrio coralliilyticus]|uniref:Uncharacterized protein n=3 Tax=Vibrio TaxID=662 RepID=A0AAN0SGZ9_9VIBR|nr:MULTISPECIES: hypothetical protein [Vibrio]AIW22449.1 hypothetical protein IX92_25625 [Vibrio coralliilyticus]NOH37010.1 hypothetical protein [Vibrio coralliilyticus]PAW00734.1 hypothetical protein CKJ79_25115 [Vibrio coralliilyticus]POB47266.1 hypothetical protein CRN52_14390 [Vibrio vulnificus]
MMITNTLNSARPASTLAEHFMLKNANFIDETEATEVLDQVESLPYGRGNVNERLEIGVGDRQPFYNVIKFRDDSILTAIPDKSGINHLVALKETKHMINARYFRDEFMRQCMTNKPFICESEVPTMSETEREDAVEAVLDRAEKALGSHSDLYRLLNLALVQCMESEHQVQFATQAKALGLI